MALCSNCGKDNREGSKFCQSCGTPLSQPSAQDAERKKKSTSEIAAGATCSSCGTLNAPGMKFCKMCGSPLESPQGGGAAKPGKVTCPSCGGETPAGYKFCQHCGTPLTATPPPSASQQAAAPAAAPPSASASPPAAAPPATGGSPAATLARPGPAMDVPKTVVPTSAPGGPAPGGPAPGGPALAGPVTGPAPAGPVAGPAPAGPAPAGPAPEAPPPAEPNMAKTIIDMEGSGPHISPTPPASMPAAPMPTPQTPNQAAVSGAIQDVPSGGVVTPETGKSSVDKATLGPGARRVTADDVEPAPPKTPLAKLVSVNRDGSDGEVHDICEESVDLGRTEGQLRFADDPYLSERHCRFYIKNGAWIVQDLESTNGVYVRLKASKELAHEDRLLLGKQVLCFEHLTDRERDLSPAVEHGVLIFGSPLRTPWCRVRQLTVAGIARDIYHLYRSKVTIGREDGDILFPDDEFMSRRHLQLSLANGKAMVEDLGSSNGTYLRIQGHRPLDRGDMIRIGDQLLRFDRV